MSKDIINDLIYVNPVSKDNRTDTKINEELKSLVKEYPIATAYILDKLPKKRGNKLSL